MNNIPNFLEDLLLEQYGKDITERIINGYSQKRPLSLRINTLKTDIVYIKNLLNDLHINYTEIPWYSSALILKDVSVTAKDAYAQVWGLYHTDELKVTGWWSYLGGKTIAVLARTPDDFPAIRQGVEKRVKDVNAGLEEMQMDIMEQPDNIVAHVNHVWANVGPDLPMLYLQYGIALFIILLVPSLNLCGLSNSRMQQRVSELGVRKAFGATGSTLIRQILNENLVLTLIGGAVGLVFSYLAVYVMRTWLFTNSQNIGTAGDFSLSMDALFSPMVFVLAFVFCLVINLLSAGLPAWLATRRTIVDSLNDK